MFTSNDTPAQEYVKARELGAVINLDDISHIGFLERETWGLPELISFRYLSLFQIIMLIAAGAFIGLSGSLGSLARFLKA